MLGSSACVPKAPDNGFVNTGVYAIGTIITYGCNSGYKVEGSVESVCLYGGLILPGAPKCVGL